MYNVSRETLVKGEIDMKKRSIYMVLMVVMVIATLLLGVCGLRTADIYSDYKLGMQQFDELQEKVLSIEGIDNDRSYTTIEMYREPIKEAGKKLLYKWWALTTVFACVVIIMAILIFRYSSKPPRYAPRNKKERNLTAIDYVRMIEGGK